MSEQLTSACWRSALSYPLWPSLSLSRHVCSPFCSSHSFKSSTSIEKASVRRTDKTSKTSISSSMADNRLYTPAFPRNCKPILSVIRPLLPPPPALVLEIASGSGEHVVFFSQSLDPAFAFQPSDPDPACLKSISSWIADSGVTNVKAPVLLDASKDVSDWPVKSADAILCVNMVHISPWAATKGLFEGAAQVLPEGAPLYLYGPYRQKGVVTASSNESFDHMLKSINREWGLRQLDDVAAIAKREGFSAPEVIEMPANNLSVVFRKVRQM
eukprot:TRINITY_DN32455_c0_g1_i1.p1 TRINITY_DN32455_c0_g1~~TRINITY_DN32455_c0_g1_i1.p1  ORF type:complete len:271 (+),score=5.62 TRINITY_DN32455_c0_g1_i1:183-995(+)